MTQLYITCAIGFRSDWRSLDGPTRSVYWLALATGLVLGYQHGGLIGTVRIVLICAGLGLPLGRLLHLLMLHNSDPEAHERSYEP